MTAIILCKTKIRQKSNQGKATWVGILISRQNRVIQVILNNTVFGKYYITLVYGFAAYLHQGRAAYLSELAFNIYRRMTLQGIHC